MEQLPNELLTQILELVYIPRKNYWGHPDQACLATRDLLSVMRCSRRLQTLGLPVLWRRLVQTSFYGITNFISAAIDHPLLASHIQSVELSMADIERTLHPINTALIPEWCKKKMCHYLQSKGYRVEQSAYGPYKTLVEFVLSLVSNTEYLTLHIPWESNETRLRLLADAFECADRAKHLEFLPKLRELDLVTRKSHLALELPTLLKIMGHRSLETFRVYNISMKRAALPLEPSERRTISLKHVKFESSSIQPDSLMTLLGACQTLESLSYDHDDKVGAFYPHQFGQGIQHLKSSLKELSVFRRELLQDFPSLALGTGAEICTNIGSLTGFEVLTSLSITAHLLLGDQLTPNSAWSRLYTEHAGDRSNQNLSGVLPRSLQKLRLLNCGPKVPRSVIELVERMETLTPHLKSIILEFQDLVRDKYSGNFNDRCVRGIRTHSTVNNRVLAWAENECERHGIEFDVWYN